MQSIRRLFAAVGIAIASLALVMGGISLSLAESQSYATQPPATLTPSLVLPTLTSTAQPSALPTQTYTLTQTASATTFVCVPPQGWVSVILQEGQSLDKLAKQYEISVDALKQANCLASTDVPVGSLVYVPVKPSQPLPTQPKCGAPGGWVIYVVKPGDTLYNIGVRYRVTVAQLMFANCLNGTVIVSGQKLYVPYVPTSTPSATLQVISTITITPSLTSTVQLTTVVATTDVPTDTPVPPTETQVPTDTPVPPTDTVAPSATP